MGVCGGRRADAILIRNARVSRAPTRREGKTRYIRPLASGRCAVGAGARSAQAPGGHCWPEGPTPPLHPQSCCRPASRTLAA